MYANRMKCFSSCINWIALEGFQAMRKNQLPLGIVAPSWNYISNGRALYCQCRGQDSNSPSLLNFSRHSRNCLTNAKNCDDRTNSFWQRKMDSRYVEISVRKRHFAPELLVFSKLPTIQIGLSLSLTIPVGFKNCPKAVPYSV